VGRWKISVIHVFLLTLVLGGEVISQDMYFRDLLECNRFVHLLVHGEHPNNHNSPLSGYCIPKLVNPETTRIY
jgi:hypothetical protein